MKPAVVTIGGGIVGSAVARAFSTQGHDIYWFEKDKIANGTSSRSSGVLHASIYYDSDSVKAYTCLNGNKLTREYCESNSRFDNSYMKCGKLIVAVDAKEKPLLEELRKKGEANGVEGLEILTSRALREKEPNAKGVAALWSPNTAVVDQYELVSAYAADAQQNGTHLFAHTKVVGINYTGTKYVVEVEQTQRNGSKERWEVEADVVINSAGLFADEIARDFLGIDDYKVVPVKGEYADIIASKSNLLQRLVYPVPYEAEGWLGSHLTSFVTDDNGRMSVELKIGPNSVAAAKKEDYEIEWTEEKLDKFYESATRIVQGIERSDVREGTYCGNRPILHVNDIPYKDFLIVEEEAKGFPGFYNLLGIASPGFTAALSIADELVLDVKKRCSSVVSRGSKESS